MKKKACILGLLGAFAALTLGCGSSEEETTAATPAPSATPAAPGEQAPATKEPWKPKSPEVMAQKKAAQPEAEITRGKLPEGFPSDVPIYPDAQAKTSMMVGTSGLVVLGSSASIADVLSHYREQLPSQGWTVDSVDEGAGGTKISVKAHKGMRSTKISINEAKAGGTEIGISIQGS